MEDGEDREERGGIKSPIDGRTRLGGRRELSPTSPACAVRGSCSVCLWEISHCGSQAQTFDSLKCRFASVPPDTFLPAFFFFFLYCTSRCSCGQHQRVLCKLVTAKESPLANKHIQKWATAPPAAPGEVWSSLLRGFTCVRREKETHFKPVLLHTGAAGLIGKSTAPL